MKLKKKKTKAEIIAIISLVAFALLGIISIAVGYGIRDGWDSVLKWFVSRWAIYVYIALVLIGFVAVYVIHKARMDE